MDLAVRHPLLHILFGVTLWALPACGQSEPEGLQHLPAIPAFSLLEADGEPFTEADLDGSIWVVNFFFTTCPSICPPLMHAVKEVEQRWHDDEDVRFLSISVHPQFDTPEVLRAYRERMELDGSQWALLTGDPDGIVELAEGGFKSAVAREMDDEGDILHSSRVLVLDRKRAIRGWFDLFEEAEHDKLDAVLRYLRKQKS